MARAKAARRKAPSGTPEDRLIAAALDLAARQGWRRTGLNDIATEAGLKLHEAYALHRSKGAILRAFTRRVDREVLSGAVPDAGESARDRLFEIMMRRFEALKPHREAIRAIARDSIGDPHALLRVPAMRLSMRWMVEAAGVSTTGCTGRIFVNLILALHLSVLRTFLADDSPDLARTMAALDQGLRRGEQLCRYLPRRRREAAAAPV
jgi:AcrR family transcriptional regulator